MGGDWLPKETTNRERLVHTLSPKENALKSFTRKTRLNAIATKRKGPSSNASKLAMFIRTQMAAGVSHERAWASARKLNVCNINDE